MQHNLIYVASKGRSSVDVSRDRVRTKTHAKKRGALTFGRLRARDGRGHYIIRSISAIVAREASND